MRLIAEFRFGTDCPVLGGAQWFFVAGLTLLQAGHDRAKKMSVEQRVKIGEPFRRRCQRRTRRAANVFHLRRSE